MFERPKRQRRKALVSTALMGGYGLSNLYVDHTKYQGRRLLREPVEQNVGAFFFLQACSTL